MRNGTKVTCSADGNPGPKVHWIELDGGGGVHNSSELDLCNVERTAGDVSRRTAGDDLLNFQCVAVRNERTAKINFTIIDAAVQKYCDSGRVLI